MSATGTARALSAVPNSVPFKAGYDPRRQQGPRMSPAELEFRRLLEEEHIPRASALLTVICAEAMNGDMKAAELFFKVCGLIKKPSDDAAVADTAKALLGEMIAEAQARRDAAGPPER